LPGQSAQALGARKIDIHRVEQSVVSQRTQTLFPYAAATDNRNIHS
jgi:hypothetical protein